MAVLCGAAQVISETRIVNEYLTHARASLQNISLRLHQKTSAKTCTLLAKTQITRESVKTIKLYFNGHIFKFVLFFSNNFFRNLLLSFKIFHISLIESILCL